MMETRSRLILFMTGTLHGSMHNATGYLAEYDESQQMTFGVIWEVGHKFNRGKSIQCKFCVGKLWHFFAAARGLARILPRCSSLRETILG